MNKPKKVQAVHTDKVEKKVPKKKTWADVPSFSWLETDHQLSQHIDDVIYTYP